MHKLASSTGSIVIGDWSPIHAVHVCLSVCLFICASDHSSIKIKRVGGAPHMEVCRTIGSDHPWIPFLEGTDEPATASERGVQNLSPFPSFLPSFLPSIAFWQWCTERAFGPNVRAEPLLYVRPNVDLALKYEFQLLKERSFLLDQLVIYRTFAVSALKILPIKGVPYKFYVPNIQYMFRECAEHSVNMPNLWWIFLMYVNRPNISRTLVFDLPFGFFGCRMFVFSRNWKILFRCITTLIKLLYRPIVSEWWTDISLLFLMGKVLVGSTKLLFFPVECTSRKCMTDLSILVLFTLQSVTLLLGQCKLPTKLGRHWNYVARLGACYKK